MSGAGAITLSLDAQVLAHLQERRYTGRWVEVWRIVDGLGGSAPPVAVRRALERLAGEGYVWSDRHGRGARWTARLW